MKKLIKNILSLIALIIMTSCLGDIKSNSRDDSKEESVMNSEIIEKDSKEIEDIKERLCKEFPKNLILEHNTDASRIEVEPVENGSGGLLHCDVKLFYGEKEYEFWKGQVFAAKNLQADPFWQYNPERNSALYHRVEGFGEKAVFITNLNQLLILKNGVIYGITPPNRGRVTNTGKENKEIALEMAEHYNI